jgi:murein DD-endopeptidase MepM/ murein hydrolase activator NlpD
MTVEIDHGDGYVTRYGHHSENYVKVGDVISAGDTIARTGTTGRSTGTHLHFEIIKNKKFQNPLDYIR